MSPHCLPATRQLPVVEALSPSFDPSFDPWHVFQQLAHLPHAIFLDSALEHPHLGRYSFIAADPFGFVRARGNQVILRGLTPPARLNSANPWNELAEQLLRYPAETVPGLPPFQGGAAGLFGYDLCHHLERLPQMRLGARASEHPGRTRHHRNKLAANGSEIWVAVAGTRCPI